MKSARLLSLVVWPLVGCAGAAPAVDTATTQVQAVAQASASPTLSTDDAAFLDRAGHTGIEAVAFGQLARTQASRAAVRDLALQQVDTFTHLNQALTRLAAAKQVTLPLDMDLAHQQGYATLQPLQGRGFDRAYLNGGATDAQALLLLLRDEAANGSDAQVRALAARTAPEMADRLHAIERLGGRPIPPA